MSGPDDALLFRSQVAGEVGHAVRFHPDPAISDFYMLEDVCLGKFVLLALRCLSLIRPQRRNIDQGGDAALHTGVRYDGSAIGVSDQDNRTADSSECADRRIDVALQRVEAVLSSDHLVPFRPQSRYQLLET